MMKVLLVIVFVAVAAVSAQRPQPCVSPRLFESRYYEVQLAKNITVRAKFSYDGVYKRERIVEQVDESQHRKDFYDILYLHQTRQMYVLNLKTKKCQRLPVNRPWIPAEIPPKAEFLAEEYIGDAGIPNEGLLIQTWAGKIPNVASYLGSWTAKGCLPVSNSMVHAQYGVILQSFYDVTLGISDPNVFIPPRECYQQGKVLVTTENDTGDRQPGQVYQYRQWR